MGFQATGSFVLVPYTSHHGESVRNLLFGWKAFPETDIASLLDLLDVNAIRTDSGETLGWLAQTPENRELLAVSLVEPVPLMLDRWMVRLLAVAPGETKRGLGSALLRASEAVAVRYRANYTAAEIPWFLDSEITDRFFWSQGYKPYDGLGLPKRYLKSRYVVRELKPPPFLTQFSTR